MPSFTNSLRASVARLLATVGELVTVKPIAGGAFDPATDSAAAFTGTEFTCYCAAGESDPLGIGRDVGAVVARGPSAEGAEWVATFSYTDGSRIAKGALVTIGSRRALVVEDPKPYPPVSPVVYRVKLRG